MMYVVVVMLKSHKWASLGPCRFAEMPQSATYQFLHFIFQLEMILGQIIVLLELFSAHCFEYRFVFLSSFLNLCN